MINAPALSCSPVPLYCRTTFQFQMKVQYFTELNEHAISTTTSLSSLAKALSTRHLISTLEATLAERTGVVTPLDWA